MPPYIHVVGTTKPPLSAAGITNCSAAASSACSGRTAENAEADTVPVSDGSLTSTVASSAVTLSGTWAVTSTCRASTSASAAKAAFSAAGSASMTWPWPASAMSSSAAMAAPVCSRATTSTRTSASVTALVASSSVASLPLSAPSERTSSERWPSSPARSVAAMMPS